MPTTALSPIESAKSIASELSVLSQFSILNSLAPLEGAAPTITSSYSNTPTSTPQTSTKQQAEESEAATSTPSSYSNYLSPTQTSASPTAVSTTYQVGFGKGDGDSDGDNSGWGNMADGTHIGVILSIIVAVVLIIVLSFWFCCGGRARWIRKHETRADAGGLPLYTVRNGRNTRPGVHRADGGGGDAPPVYEEVAPPLHQTLAGGVRTAEEAMEEEAVVSDGKTPLSEIPFEDVVLERHPSESESSSSASRGFEMTHHAMGGDTRGHTNT